MSSLVFVAPPPFRSRDALSEIDRLETVAILIYVVALAFMLGVVVTTTRLEPEVRRITRDTHKLNEEVALENAKAAHYKEQAEAAEKEKDV